MGNECQLKLKNNLEGLFVILQRMFHSFSRKIVSSCKKKTHPSRYYTICHCRVVVLFSVSLLGIDGDSRFASLHRFPQIPDRDQGSGIDRNLSSHVKIDEELRQINTCSSIPSSINKDPSIREGIEGDSSMRRRVGQRWEVAKMTGGGEAMF